MGRAATALRLALLLTGIIVLWRGALALPGAQDGYHVGRHLLQGGLVCAGVVLLVHALLRRDGRTWREAGFASLPANLRAFASGAALWLLPALAGGALCLALGWSTISLVSSPMAILAAVPPLALGVLLFEAFPEELAIRGYAQGLVGRRHAAWVALLAQMLLFVAFAWAVGALSSTRQWMFLPGFALILGYARALSGNVWTSIGVHAAWMTTAQLLSPGHGHVSVTGMQTLQFLAFALLPSMAIGIVLPLRNPSFDWRRPMR